MVEKGIYPYDYIIFILMINYMCQLVSYHYSLNL